MSVSPIPNCVQVDMKMLVDGQTVQNSFFYQFPITPSVGALNSLATEAVTAWTAHIAPHLSDQLSLEEVVCTDLSGLTGPRVDLQVNPPVHGGNASGFLPLNATLAIKRTGAVRGRGTTGRIFWPTLPPTEVAFDRVSDTYIGGIVNAISLFDADLVAVCPTGTLPAVPHKTGVHHGTSTPLIDWGTADDYVDSQRDRLPRHKRHKKHHTP